MPPDHYQSSISDPDISLSATIDISVIGFAEEVEELIFSFPPAENISNGFITIHS